MADTHPKLTLNAAGQWVINSSATDHVLQTAGKYLDRDIKVAAITPSTVTNSVIGGVSNVKGDATGIDTFTVSVNIPAGYYNGISLSKTFDNILPNFTTNAPVEYILNGQTAYDDQGRKLTGTMPNNENIDLANKITMTKGNGSVNASSTFITLTDAGSTAPTDASSYYIKVDGSGSMTASYEIPFGYYPEGKIVSGAATSSKTATKYYKMNTAVTTGSCTPINFTAANLELNSTNRKYSFADSTTAVAKVTTAGYSPLNTEYRVTANASVSLDQSKVTYLNGSTPTEIGSATATSITLVSKDSTITKGYHDKDRLITVRNASGLSLNITDKTSTNIMVGSESGGYYPLSAGLTGTITASTPGWFTSTSLGDDTVIVGRIAKASFKWDQTATPDPTKAAPKYELTASAGYVATGIAGSIPVYNGECA